MENPNIPQGWALTVWQYHGESTADYPPGFGKWGCENLIYMIEKPLNPQIDLAKQITSDPNLLEVETNRIWLELSESVTSDEPHFAVKRVAHTKKYELTDDLTELIASVQQGIDYCGLIAEKYMDTPSEFIPKPEDKLHEQEVRAELGFPPLE